MRRARCRRHTVAGAGCLAANDGLTSAHGDAYSSDVRARVLSLVRCTLPHALGRQGLPVPGVEAEDPVRFGNDVPDERTGAELLLRLRERKLKRDLAGADLAKTTELQAHLAKVRQAIAELT